MLRSPSGRGEQNQVERWLNCLLRLRGIKRLEETEEPVSLGNNITTRATSVDMAWEAPHRNHTLFRECIERLPLVRARRGPVR